MATGTDANDTTGFKHLQDVELRTSMMNDTRIINTARTFFFFLSLSYQARDPGGLADVLAPCMAMGIDVPRWEVLQSVSPFLVVSSK